MKKFNLCMCKTDDYCKIHDCSFGKLLLAPVVFLTLVGQVVYNSIKRFITKRDEPYCYRRDHALDELKTLSPMFTTWLLLEVFVLKFSHVLCCPTWLAQLIEAF